MKKHLGALLLTLLLVALVNTAAAQDYYTLPEIREQAAPGWHQTYTDKYGRTRQVDVNIEVFGEETAPVVKACWGTTGFDVNGPAGEPRAAIIEASRVKKTGISTYPYENVSYMKVDPNQKYAEGFGNDLSLREVYDFCDALLREQGRSFYENYLWEQPYRFSILYSMDKKTGGVLVPALYSIEFCQKEFGLPLLSHVGSSFQNTSVAFTCPHFFIEMRDGEAYSCFGDDFDVSEILAEDIPLCSVDTVIEGARKFIENGWVHDVLALRFGYVVYSEPNTDWSKLPTSYDMNVWYLVPSWVMDCHVLWDPKEDELPEHPTISEIVINAQTGEMTNYFDTSLNEGGDVCYKGFIPWNNVN